MSALPRMRSASDEGKNLQHVLIKNIMVIPVVTVTFFFFGWWIYFAFIHGPFINAAWASTRSRTTSTPGRR